MNSANGIFDVDDGCDAKILLFLFEKLHVGVIKYAEFDAVCLNKKDIVSFSESDKMPC